jgi:hypothetical protein
MMMYTQLLDILLARQLLYLPLKLHHLLLMNIYVLHLNRNVKEIKETKTKNRGGIYIAQLTY